MASNGSAGGPSVFSAVPGDAEEAPGPVHMTRRSSQFSRHGRSRYSRDGADDMVVGSRRSNQGFLTSIMNSLRGDETGRNEGDAPERRQSHESLLDSSDDGYGPYMNSDDDLSNAGDSSPSGIHDGQSSSDEDRGGLLPSAFGTLGGREDPVFGDHAGGAPEDELDLDLADLEREHYLHHHPESGLHTLADMDSEPLLAGSAVDDSPATAEALQRDQEEKLFLDKSSQSRQQIYLVEEDSLIRLTGYQLVKFRHLLFLVASVCTFGIIYLLARWLPRLRLKWICRECDFAEAEFVTVTTEWGDLFEAKMCSIPFARPLTTVFPPDFSFDPPSTSAEFQAAITQRTKLFQANTASGNGSGTGNGKQAANEGSVPAAAPTFDSIDAEELFELKYLDYRYTRFVVHPPSGRLRLAKDWRDNSWTSVQAVTQGVSENQLQDRKVMFGLNSIDIAAKSTWALLVDEVLHPFYMFQIVSIVLWSVDDYYYYALCIAVISFASIITTLIETKSTVERMREMSRFSCPVTALRNGKWVTLDSTELVPGDVYDVAEPGLLLFPADSVLLSGDAIVNESMLTGESVPVSKIPVSDASMKSLLAPGSEISPELARHYLFGGTRIVRIRPAGGGLAMTQSENDKRGGAVAMVTRTGFNTTKGALVRSMLFPKPMGFKFYRDSFRFIGFLGCIACIGFTISGVGFVRMGIAWHLIVVRALDLITVVVPPALPATMSVGTAFAISRLRAKEIFCISPNRVNIAGKINVFCFDKTGTLTEDGLDVLGARTISHRENRFSELHESADEMPTADNAPKEDREARNLPLLHALATCHSLKVVDGEVIGDPLDVKMFEYTGWTLDEGRERSARAATGTGSTAKEGKARLTDRPPALVQTVVRPPGGGEFNVADALRPGKRAHFLELGVLRTFEFVSQLRRMSVVVKRMRSDSMEVFVKGAPEVMTDICLPESFPADYDDLLAYYTKHGYRVIACAGKSLPGLSWVKAQRMTRTQAESKLRFLGLIIFENKIKAGTPSAITALRTAHIGVKMVTGDNPRTAVSVARECGMLGPSTAVYMPVWTESGAEPLSEGKSIEWQNVDDEQLKLDPWALKPSEVDLHVLPLDEGGGHDYQIALSGDVFRWMVDCAPVETVRRMLLKGAVFARMSPDEKHELVERLQALGYTVGMCGDGANDCGALKAADVGISLSEAEASVAAPFTSRQPDIGCVLSTIREGRAALVTSFGCFKYMALYSLIQFTSITILYSLAASLGDFQFLYIDLFIIIPVAVAMARTEPFETLSPKRPTANLMSKKVLTSMLGQVVICALTQFIAFFYITTQPWYDPPAFDPDSMNVVNPPNSALFLVSSFQYILVAAVFSVGPPYRKPMYTNPMLVASMVILTSFSFYALFVRQGWVFDVLGLVDLPRYVHLALFAMVVLNAIASFTFETYLVVPVARTIKAFSRRIHPRHTIGRSLAAVGVIRYPSRTSQSPVQPQKLYKAVAQGMANENSSA